LTTVIEPAEPEMAHLRGDALLEVSHLTCRYGVGKNRFDAVVDVSFDLHRGETLGLVGESGSGKSTVCRAILQLPHPALGSVRFDGGELTELNERALRPIRRRLQIVFQDPISSLNPRKRVASIVMQGLKLRGFNATIAAAKANETLAEVGLDPAMYGKRKPKQLSGGQCQRVALARSLVMEPDILVCDEIVSALDVTVQAQVLALLQALKRRHGLALLFVSHDLAVVRQIATRVAVMYLGRLCEVGDSASIYSSPRHPYTRALLDAVPRLDPEAPFTGSSLGGETPSPMAPPSGCRFRTRCPNAQSLCEVEEPPLRSIGADHSVACHFPLGVNPSGATASFSDVRHVRAEVSIPSEASIPLGTSDE
jgi:peptide/nickel transport system ATP-binding protein